MAKEYNKGLRSDNDEYDLCAFAIMSGGITPVSQHIDKFICKVFKSHYIEKCNYYMITVPKKENIQPIPTSSQICAQ